MTTLSEIYELLKEKEIHDKIPYSHKIKTNNKVINMSIGRVWFNLITPDDYKLIDEIVNKNKVSDIIKDIYLKYDPITVSKFVNDLNNESFKLGTIIPVTFDIDALIVPDFILEKKKQLLNDPNISASEVNKISYSLAEEYLKYIKENYNSGAYDILMSGAKGSPADWAVLMIAKGAQVDIEGNISNPILHSLDDGLTIEEFYNSAASARSVQFLKSKGSADPGYLSSQAVFASSDLMLVGDDCKTKRYLKILIQPSMTKFIIGRYYLDEKTNTLKFIENEEMAKKLANTVIKLRSPTFCIQPDGICKTCYGKLAEGLGTNKIGLLVAAIINDIGIKSAMKTRHLASQINIKKTNFIKDIIVN